MSPRATIQWHRDREPRVRLRAVSPSRGAGYTGSEDVQPQRHGRARESPPASPKSGPAAWNERRGDLPVEMPVGAPPATTDQREAASAPLTMRPTTLAADGGSAAAAESRVRLPTLVPGAFRTKRAIPRHSAPTGFVTEFTSMNFAASVLPSRDFDGEVVCRLHRSVRPRGSQLECSIDWPVVKSSPPSVVDTLELRLRRRLFHERIKRLGMRRAVLPSLICAPLKQLHAQPSSVRWIREDVGDSVHGLIRAVDGQAREKSRHARNAKFPEHPRSPTRCALRHQRHAWESCAAFFTTLQA